MRVRIAGDREQGKRKHEIFYVIMKEKLFPLSVVFGRKNMGRMPIIFVNNARSCRGKTQARTKQNLMVVGDIISGLRKRIKEELPSMIKTGKWREECQLKQ